eukprot:366286-Chlamydomonas_euryale.AAC.6
MSAREALAISLARAHGRCHARHHYAGRCWLIELRCPAADAGGRVPPHACRDGISAGAPSIGHRRDRGRPREVLLTQLPLQLRRRISRHGQRVGGTSPQRQCGGRAKPVPEGDARCACAGCMPVHLNLKAA